MTEIKKHKNLSNVKGTYAKVISDHLSEINNICTIDRKPVNEAKNYIKDLVIKESKVTNAQQNFLAQLEKQRTLDSICILCYNVMLKADNLGVC